MAEGYVEPIDRVYIDPDDPNSFVQYLYTDESGLFVINYKRYPGGASIIRADSTPVPLTSFVQANTLAVTAVTEVTTQDQANSILQNPNATDAERIAAQQFYGAPIDSAGDIIVGGGGEVLVDGALNDTTSSASGFQSGGAEEPADVNRSAPQLDITAPIGGFNDITNLISGLTGTVNDDSYDFATDPFREQFQTLITNYVTGQNSPIDSQPNVLDRFASYNYSASLYIMDTADINLLLVQKNKIIPPNSLLIQSGGIPAGTDLPFTDFSFDNPAGGLNNTSNRNQFFDVDFFIDDIKLQSLVPGKGTQSSINTFEVDFKITEPYGITLLDRLFQAVNALNNGDRSKNYASQNFLLVMRFYGYDKDGNLITNIDNTENTDRYAFVEKFIPIVFKNITFRIQNSITEYSCSAVVPQTQIAMGQGRGSVPFNIELEASTLSQLFNGTGAGAGANTGSPENIGAATSSATTEGLMPALNRYQKELVQQGVQELADTYRLLMPQSIIANSKIIPPGGLNRSDRPMTIASTTGQALNPGASFVDNSQKTSSATAGMMITQFLDQSVRNSEYIYNQQRFIIDKDNKLVEQPGVGNSFSWFRIGTQVRPIGYDHKRNDYAYEITYEIAPYGISYIKSNYFPNGEYVGSHKVYNYWYTGENTQVLRYEQDFNYLYFLTLNNNSANIEDNFGTSDYREIEKRLFQKNSAQSNQGTDTNVNEPAANAAEYLYSPGDQSKVSLNIIGDPAWISQGELWSGVRSDGPNNNGYDPYTAVWLPDGTINFDARETLFEINFKKPVDYSINTGVMDTTNSRLQTYVYRAVQIESSFSKGKFTQQLDGVLIVFPNLEEQKYFTDNLSTFGLNVVDTEDQISIGQVANTLSVLGGAVAESSGASTDNFTSGTSNFAQQSPGSARAFGQRGFAQAGDESNALDAIAADNETFQLNQTIARDD